MYAFATDIHIGRDADDKRKAREERSHGPQADDSNAEWKLFGDVPHHNEFKPMTVTLSGDPPGMRYAVIRLGGKDTKRWEGHYGAKFGSPQLCFTPPVRPGDAASVGEIMPGRGHKAWVHHLQKPGSRARPGEFVDLGNFAFDSDLSDCSD